MSSSENFHGSDEEARVEAGKKREELDQLRQNENMRKVLASYEGRALLWDLMAEFGTQDDPYRGENTHDTARACGKLACGQSILLKVLTCTPEAYNLMQMEYAKRKQNLESK